MHVLFISLDPARSLPATNAKHCVNDKLGGDACIISIHITDLHVAVPISYASCVFQRLKELDLDGGSLTGTILQWLSTCMHVLVYAALRKAGNRFLACRFELEGFSSVSVFLAALPTPEVVHL